VSGRKASGDAYEVQGRGELQLGVLIETMRREGFEMSVSPPAVVYQEGEDGKKKEPIEEVMIQVCLQAIV
jgi:GTP-binding protein